MTSDVRSSTPPPPPATSGNMQSQTPMVTARPRSLMEQLLVAKMEKAGACLTSGSPPSPLPPALLLRTDSTDSASSLSSTSSDVCRCDDCLLGIADLYVTDPDDDSRRKKTKIMLTSVIINHFNMLRSNDDVQILLTVSSDRVEFKLRFFPDVSPETASGSLKTMANTG
ncbi:hypothetical protein L9F63_015385, partial [Diploptera punctata]